MEEIITVYLAMLAVVWVVVVATIAGDDKLRGQAKEMPIVASICVLIFSVAWPVFLSIVITAKAIKTLGNFKEKNYGG